MFVADSTIDNKHSLREANELNAAAMGCTAACA